MLSWCISPSLQEPGITREVAYLVSKDVCASAVSDEDRPLPLPEVLPGSLRNQEGIPACAACSPHGTSPALSGRPDARPDRQTIGSSNGRNSCRADARAQDSTKRGTNTSDAITSRLTVAVAKGSSEVGGRAICQRRIFRGQRIDFDEL